MLLSYGGRSGSAHGYLNRPGHLVVDKYGFVFVSDCDNNRIVVLDSALNWSHDLVISPAVHGGLMRPWPLCYNESRDQLYVGEWELDGRNRLIVFQL